MFSNSPTAQYFRKHLTLANSIVVAGSGIGTLALGPFYEFILSNFGWRMMLRILSGFAFVVFLIALLYRPFPDKYKRTKQEPTKGSQFFDLSVWKMKPFVVWVVSMSLMFIGYFVPFMHLVSRYSCYRLNTHKLTSDLYHPFRSFSFSFIDTPVGFQFALV